MRRLVIAVAFCCVLLPGAAVSSAQAASPWLNLNTSLRPSTLKPGAVGTLVLRATNLGDAPTSGPITIAATLPAGTEVLEEEGVPQILFIGPLKTTLDGTAPARLAHELCQATTTQVTCATEPADPAAAYRAFIEKSLEEFGFTPPFEPELIQAAEEFFPRAAFEEEHSIAFLAPYEGLEIRLKVLASSTASSGEYTAEVSGGQAGALSRHRPLPIGEADPVFGAEDLSLIPEAEGGAIDARAASHPFQLTNTFNLNQSSDLTRPPALARNLDFKLPPGQLGNATAYPRCSLAQFFTHLPGGTNLCPDSSAIGVASITIAESGNLGEPVNLGLQTLPTPIFNLEPGPGEPARFGFLVTVEGNPVILDTSLRSGNGEDYGVTVSARNTTQQVNFIASTVTFWGAPGDPRHNASRGWGCLASGFHLKEGGPLACNPTSQPQPSAFLTMPTGCAAPFATSVQGTSWPNQAFPSGATLAPLSYSLKDEAGNPLGLVGCNQVPFSPTISAQPSTENASAPSGLDVNIDFHDEGLINSEGLAQSQLKDTTVTLPEGFTINPSAGVGLGGCTSADYARESIESAAGAGCPNNSKLGTVEIETPLLTQKIRGSLFIAQPHENPFNSLVALYIVAKNPETGVLIKLAGKVTPNPITGQLTTTFENNPQLPFDHFNFHFREGQQAPLISPPACGTYTTTAQLTPWSDPTTALTKTSSFTITKGFDGGACPSGGVAPFHPGIQSGMLNNNAGVFSPFYLHLTRTDGEQEISGFSTNLPEGLTGNLTGIPFCPEAQIALARTKTGREEEANPSCPAQSQVGHTLVGTGVGAVLAYVPGKIYLAGPFHGAPFSLVAVTSAVVGPFDLGTVVLRFGLNIDPYTAQVSVSPTTSEPIPTIIDGIVTHVRDIRVYIDRQNFTLNPTSCNPLAIGSTLNSSLGASATVTSPFQAASCANLKFAPKFAVSTSGKTSKANGASLAVKLTYPQGPAGTYANIAKVKVDLPKQLPSRLTTLQKACTAAQFNSNPAGCPAASFIGHAKAVTPLIPVPLEGPAIFVSHGGEAFPSLIMVLQGYGVTVDLVGSTFISKSGITSSTFKTVPDQPIGSFELTLPQGKFSALAANGNLCVGKLAMPTEFVAQNGAKINRSTPVSVSGCAKKKALTRAQKLALALKACHRNRSKAKRASCDKQARKKYGPIKRSRPKSAARGKKK
jgi:hypothetical protein